MKKIQLSDLEILLKSQLEKKNLNNLAHFDMIPSIRMTKPQNEVEKSVPKLSSVIILLFQKDNRIYFIVTQRQDYDGVHSGQISFPGGKWEKTDSNIQDTALRECFEEIGIHPDDIKILGQISELYIPPSNYHVTPFIGICKNIPNYHLDPKEVARVIEIPLGNLFQEDVVKIKGFKAITGLTIQAPYYDLEGVEIWGATAMILSEFKSIVGRIFGI